MGGSFAFTWINTTSKNVVEKKGMPIGKLEVLTVFFLTPRVKVGDMLTRSEKSRLN